MKILIKKIIPQYDRTITKFKQLCRLKNINPLNIIPGIIHMDCNRTFVMNQRANEWIIYHYLARYSRTVIARKFKPGVDVLNGFG